MAKQYTPELQGQVMAALLAGQSVSSVAKQYNIPKGTVSGWKRQAQSLVESEGVAGVATQKRERIGQLIIDNVEAELETMIAMQKNVFTDREWLKQQSASELAVLYGVIKDKAIRVLEALPDPEPGDEAADLS